MSPDDVPCISLKYIARIPTVTLATIHDRSFEKQPLTNYGWRRLSGVCGGYDTSSGVAGGEAEGISTTQ